MTGQVYRLAHNSHVKDSDAQRRHLDVMLRCLIPDTPHLDPLTWHPQHEGDFKVIREKRESDSKKQSDGKKEPGSNKREITVDQFVAFATDVMARFEAWATWAAGTLHRPAHSGHAQDDHAYVAGALVDVLSTSSSFLAGVWFSEFEFKPLQGMDLIMPWPCNSNAACRFGLEGVRYPPEGSRYGTPSGLPPRRLGSRSNCPDGECAMALAVSLTYGASYPWLVSNAACHSGASSREPGTSCILPAPAGMFGHQCFTCV
jgi:hypothetical protein